MKFKTENLQMTSRLFKEDDIGAPHEGSTKKLRTFVLTFTVSTTPDTNKIEFEFTFQKLKLKYEVRKDNVISKELRVNVNEKK